MKVLTGALAIVKVNGKVVGKMRNVRIEEGFRRVRVGGLGTILPQEQSAIEWTGRLTAGQYEIDFKKSGIPGAVRRDVANKQEFEDQVVLDADGVQVDIFKKVSDVIDPNTKLIKAKLNPYATVTRCLIENDNVDINEGQVAGRNQTFTYLDPVLDKEVV